MLYLPVFDEGENVVICALKDGRRALMAYTALDRLAAMCGDQQPWLLMLTQNLGSIKEVQPFDVVAFDVELPMSYRSAAVR